VAPAEWQRHACRFPLLCSDAGWLVTLMSSCAAPPCLLPSFHSRRAGWVHEATRHAARVADGLSLAAPLHTAGCWLSAAATHS
jgi:hypothetical protein